jgi:prepilin-type N-terminal cleavage/methylation domain-containing protein
MKQNNRKEGFTLIEILVVIGIIAVLATVVLIAINPARQFAQARDSQRTSNVSTILDSIGQRIADNKGLFPTAPGCVALTVGTTYTIGLGSGTFVAPATALIDISCLVPTYIASQLPVDPTNGIWTSASVYNTQYNVTVDINGRYTISAPNALLETAISATPPAISITR